MSKQSRLNKERAQRAKANSGDKSMEGSRNNQGMPSAQQQRGEGASDEKGLKQEKK